MRKLKTEDLKKKSSKDLKEMKKTLEFALSSSYGMMKTGEGDKIPKTIKRNIARINTILKAKEVRDDN